MFSADLLGYKPDFDQAAGGSQIVNVPVRTGSDLPVVLDEGGLVWKGSRHYSTLDAALADAEAGVACWVKEQPGITDTAFPGR